MSRKFTVIVSDETMVIQDGQADKSRPMWYCAGVIWFVKGSLEKKKYEQAANLVMNHAQGMHIYPSSIKAYTSSRAIRGLETQSQRMKGF